MVAKVPGMWEPGESFDGYVIESVIGRGGMGFVYKARQTGLDRDVAIKTLLPQHLDKAEYLARFLREGRAATRIKSRHVVQVFDVRQRGDVPYLVMELLSGVPLDEHIEQGGAMAPKAAVDVMLAVCDAVSAAHRVGVIHRDLKPANVFLCRAEDGALEPRVVDFGISRLQDNLQDGLQTGSHALLGTPAYLSPEQTRGSKYITERSDQYALGLILYECLTGSLAFPDNDFFVLIRRIGTGEFVPPRAVRADIPEALEAVVLRAMACEPDARFDSVAALAEALLPFTGDRERARWSSLLGAGALDTLQQMGPPSVPPGTMAPPPAAAPLPDAPTGRRSTLSGSALELMKQNSPPRLDPRRPLGAAAIALLLVGLGGAAYVERGRASTSPSDFGVSIRTVPAEATVVVDGRQTSVGRFGGRFPRDGVRHHLLVSAPGWEPREITFAGEVSEREIRLARSSPLAAPPAEQTVALAPAMPALVTPAPDTGPAARVDRHGRRRSHRGHRGATSEAIVARAQSAAPTPPPALEPSNGTNGASIR